MPDPLNFTVITSVATSGSTDDQQALYDEVWAFHQGLAVKYGAVRPGGEAPIPKRAVRVIVSSASLRGGPGNQFNRLGFAKQGDVLEIVGDGEGWIQSPLGWINKIQVEIV